MVPFDFRPSTRVVFGHRTLLRLGHIARELSFRRTLLVSDKGVAGAGHIAAAERHLRTADVDVVVFAEFNGAPDPATIESGRRAAEAARIDSIVAIGGGSTIDGAKAIGFVLTGGGSIADYAGHGKPTRPLLPIVAVPTTAGTGAEAQSRAMVLDAAAHVTISCSDPSAAPRVALLDPDLTLTAPKHVTAMAGFDAVAHAVETAVSTRRTPMSDTFSHQAWRLLNDAFERVLLHPEDPDSRAAMQLGSHFAGMAVELSMLGAAHACAGPLTARHNVAHGLALAILLPHVVRWNATVASQRYMALLGSPRRRARDEDPAESLARRLEDLGSAAGLVLTLADAGVEDAALPSLAADAARHWTSGFNPRPLDAAGALEIYRAAL
jgi:alcohol dehydrogenase